MKIQQKLRRASRIFAALVLGAAALTPGVLAGKAFAATQLDSRSIEMSNSAANASGVQYTIKFTTHSTMGSVVVDFCGDSPIIGATCGALTGFSASSAALTTGSPASWTATGSGSNLELNKAGGADVTAGVVTFVVTGIHNPTATGSFYARAYTYTDGAAAAYTDPDTLGTHLEEGGFAMSTANQVSVSGTVQETLTFCVSGDETTSDGCATPTTPALTLGTGTPVVLDGATVYTGDVFSQLSTNAAHGAAVRMKNSNTCGGLSRDSGSTCDIAPSGATANTIGSGEAEFGMKAASDDVSLTTQTPYDTGNYGMDVTTSGNNVASTYGSTVASSTGVLDAVNTTYTFGARANNTTPAGLYTATMTLIATGTY